VPLLGITGGIATGKSTFTRLLAGRLSGEVFDADRAAHELLASDPAVRLAVEKSFGAGYYGDDGRPDRARLRDLIFSDDLHRRRLEEILHPAIRARWLAQAGRIVENGGWLYVDLPLLYETRAESQFDRVIVVACSPATQRRRLETERGLTAETAVKIISAQLDLETKIKRADHLVWSDSTTESLDAQADLLAAWLLHRYG
jgi:dephospho-CoA kinase